MTESRMNEFLEESSRLRELTDYLYDLLSSEAAKKWKGDGAQACLRESLDNRELALLAIGECQKITDLTGQKPEQKAVLPSSLLL